MKVLAINEMSWHMKKLADHLIEEGHKLYDQADDAKGRVESPERYRGLHRLVAKKRRWLRSWQTRLYQRRLRRAIIDTTVQFGQLYPEWQEFLFDRHFLLNRGLPVIERHIAGTASRSAMDLALAWAEQWPQMNAGRRKTHLQTLTPIAAEFLRLLEKRLMNSHLANGANSGAKRQRIGPPIIDIG
jgi:hypothetical protein